MSSSNTSPVKRTDRRRLNTSLVDTSFTSDNDTNDGRRRAVRGRRETLLAINRHGGSPSNSPVRSNRRQSLQKPLVGMSHVQLTDHYSNCIKLSTENKINPKNAFTLHLIDYMSDMLVDRDDQVVYNFVAASSSLDASSKIYGHRVDLIHKETFNIRSELIRTSKGNKAQGETEDPDDGGDQHDGDDNARASRKKKRKKSQNIASDAKTLTVDKLDLQFEVDPLFHKTTELFAKGGQCGLFLTLLSSENDHGRLMLDPDIAWTSRLTKDDSVDTTTVDVDNVGLTDIESLAICDAFAGFKFENWNPTEQQQHDFSIDSGDHAPPAEDNFFSGGGGCDFGNDSDGNSDADGGADDGGGGGHNPDDNGDLDINSNVDVAITTNNLTSLLSSNPSEYSYFQKDRLFTWAGPDYWKGLPASKARSTPTDGSAEGRVTKSKSKKPAFYLSYEEELDIEELLFHADAATTLSRRVIGATTEEALTLPEDHHFTIEQLLVLALLPNMKVDISRPEKEDTEQATAEPMDYNYHNPNDVDNYCPATNTSTNDYHDDYDGADTGFDDAGNGSGPSMCFQGDNLIAPPTKVPRFEMAQMKSAKRINVKKLKSTMWNLMSDKEPANETVVEDVAEEKANERTIVGGKSFIEVYGNLPGKISTEMERELSIPIAFFCLLDLSNEKGLHLQSQADMKDVTILMAES